MSIRIIAEISGNHGGHLSRALQLVEAVADAGADTVKFQHYSPETITVRSDHPDFQVSGGTLWDGRQLADLYSEAMTPWEWTEALVERATNCGLQWLSTPFDPSAVDFLEGFDIPAYKIASFEIVDIPLIEYVASKGKPMIISTGMATIGEIDAAVAAARKSGAPEVTLLRCNSAYPALPEEMDLRSIPLMREMWRCPVGLSDHTLSSTSAIVSVALGAVAIEKHVTMCRDDGGPDAAFSLEPSELSLLVTEVNEAAATLGDPRFGPSEREMTSVAFRRSLRAVQTVKAGDLISIDNVKSVRPAGGLQPARITDILGRRAVRDITIGEPITWDMLV